jgi:hypothetical protein
MDPEVAAALLAGLLATVGVRRRAGRPGDAGTVGQKVEQRGGTVTAIGAGFVRQVGRTATSFSVGTGEVVIASAAVLARTAGTASTEVAARGIDMLGRLASRAGGLVMDGAAAVVDGAGSVVRPRRAGTAPNS